MNANVEPDENGRDVLRVDLDRRDLIDLAAGRAHVVQIGGVELRVTFVDDHRAAAIGLQRRWNEPLSKELVNGHGA